MPAANPNPGPRETLLGRVRTRSVHSVQPNTPEPRPNAIGWTTAARRGPRPVCTSRRIHGLECQRRDRPEARSAPGPSSPGTLTAARQRARLSVRDVARIANVPAGTTGGYFSGRHLPNLSFLDPFLAVLDALGIEDHDPWVAALERLRWTPSLRAADQTSPYKGLDSYQPEDAAWFFGRDAVTADILARLRERIGQGGAVAVVGASGAGKSSVLRAGVVPAVRDGALPGPGRSP